MREIAGILLSLILAIGLTGCSRLAPKQYDEDVSLRIVKSGVKIEEVRFDPDMGMEGKEIYKFTIPIEIKGTFQHDCTIPIYYFFDMERSECEVDISASAWATRGEFTRVFKGELKIPKGTTGIVYYEGETDDALMNPESTPYEYAWVAFRYEDDFIADNYAGIINPFFNEEKYLYSRGVQWFYDKIREIVPEKAEGNVRIDEDSVQIEKTYIGDEPGHPQHYTVRATIINDPEHPVATDALWVGCDYDLSDPFTTKDCYEALCESLMFLKGVSFGYTITQQSITEKDGNLQVEFDMYNRYAGYDDNLTGSDLDWYQCFWIAICLDDDNRNDNYTIVPNPYFDASHYSDEVLRNTRVIDIYRYTSVEAYNQSLDAEFN